MKNNKTAEEYISKHPEHKDALEKLRKILLKTELEETIKWGIPTYVLDGKNLIGMGAFKSYVGIWFFQGALLKDPKNVLVNAQEGVTKAQRQMRFDSAEDINEKVVKEYVQEAIQNQKAGKEIKPPRRKPLIIPDHLKEAFKAQPKVKQSFDEMNLTKQREFAEYIDQAKREETKQQRLEKIIPMIMEKRGLHDKYRN